MSHLWTIREIVDAALQKIGTYAIRHSGSQGEEFRRGCNWLDMVVAHKSSTQRCWWLVPRTVSLPLNAGQEVYVLDEVLGSALVGGGVEFVTSAHLIYTNTDGSQSKRELRMVHRQTYDANRPLQNGTQPCICYVDRQVPVTLSVYPLPPTLVAPASYSIALTIQTIPQDYTLEQEERVMQMRSAWNLWAVTALAAELGDGPVRRLPSSEVNDFRAMAEILFADLVAMDAQENISDPPRTVYNDL